jgi:hypothetical protein
MQVFYTLVTGCDVVLTSKKTTDNENFKNLWLFSLGTENLLCYAVTKSLAILTYLVTGVKVLGLHSHISMQYLCAVAVTKYYQDHSSQVKLTEYYLSFVFECVPHLVRAASPR